MRESKQEENVKATDPDDKTPSGPEVLQWLPPGRWYTSVVRDHIISLFDHITNAQSEASLAVANISSLAKIADAETLGIVLKAAVRPLVQINVPEKFLNPAADPKLKSSTEERKQKIMMSLLPNSNTKVIQKEPRNNLTCLLMVVMYLKLKRAFLNEGTQRETEERFSVHSKHLGKLLNSRCYLGGKDKKMTTKRKRKSLQLSNAVKDPDDDSNDK